MRTFVIDDGRKHAGYLQTALAEKSYVVDGVHTGHDVAITLVVSGIAGCSLFPRP